jgi:flavin-dependent dehydrogenase
MRPLELIANGQSKDRIGDCSASARHREPLSGAEILPAISSGQTASEVAHKVVRQKDATTKMLREYETEWNNSPYGKRRK